MMKISTLCILVTTIIILASCEKENNVSYIVHNQTRDSLNINYSYYTSPSDEDLSSASINLKSKQSSTLFIYLLESTKVYNPEYLNNLINLSQIDIMRIRDSAWIKKDVTLRSNWLYRKITKHSAVLEITIIDTDF